MSTFNLDGFGESVPVTLAPNITEEQLREFRAFSDWRKTLQQNLELQRNVDHPFHEHPFTLRSVEVLSASWFTPKILGFVKMKAVIQNDKEPKPDDLPGIVFLRGGSVAMLMILRPKDARDERWVVMTEQPRIPAGSLRFLEVPAGMLDKDQNFAGKAAKEIQEETGFLIPRNELVDLTKLALKDSDVSEKNLQTAMYPSPGGSDEYIPIFLWEKELDRQEIETLRGKLTGKKHQGELITLRVLEYESLWKEAARDAKTLAAWALYEGLRREGTIQKIFEERERSHKDTEQLK